MIIKDFFNKIKSIFTIDRYYFLCLLTILLVAISAFGLGRLSMYKANMKEESSISISNRVIANKNTLSKNYVASKTGKIYYGVKCSTVSRIKVENRIYFNSKKDAESSGYTLSKNC